MADKIIFILGAGASIPFAQPSGKQLIKVITDSLIFTPKRIYGTGGRRTSLIPDYEIDDSQTDNKLLEMIFEAGFTHEQVEHFRLSLMNSQINSVDAFLEHRTEFIPIGKMAIAYNLLARETFSKQKFTSDPDWYQYLWNKLINRLPEFPRNDIAIVTFNYDRTFEYFIYNSFKSLYGLSDKESQSFINKVEVIHLHGSLGNLPWQSGEIKVEFGEEIDEYDQLLKVSGSIKIIHEDVTSNAEFKRAFELMNSSNRIYFMGFGYNSTNLDRLRINEIKTTILGTSIGLTDNERTQIEKNYRNIRLRGLENIDCLEFLKECVELR